MRDIKWIKVFNRASKALDKFVSIGMTIDHYNSQKKMQRCIWEGYGRFGMGAVGNMMGYGCNIWDTSNIINNGILRMQQYTAQTTGYDGITDAIGGNTGGSIRGIGTVPGTDTAQSQVDSKQGQSLANGLDTKSIDNDELNVIDKNQDGKITKDEFVDYFKNNLQSNSGIANIDSIASAAWDKLNFNANDTEADNSSQADTTVKEDSSDDDDNNGGSPTSA